MKVVIVISFLCLLVATTQADRGCMLIDGICAYPCPEGTMAYLSPCQPGAPTWSQKTCTKPESVDLGPMCDLSYCACDDPTVYDNVSQKCVLLQDCPK